MFRQRHHPRFTDLVSFGVEDFVFFLQRSDLLLKHPNARSLKTCDLRVLGRVGFA